ncbi:hypothetical protein DKM44_14475 [Deinococcus irradiatisoli]|uniref:Uncharacterized protein n=1 Tax=Deinococcus irradiatisoli TaxID=2202254 RepID=A0A2Z3JH10_9DEIO|nr:hypothetical protein [Deinococcus irradiatisoli]AWN24285.1 hypothetical protein DKM44_14475 [Deinococcus irradiatisoli]
MTDKLDDTTPLAGLTPEPAPGPAHGDEGLLGRVLNPDPDPAYTSGDGEEPGILTALVRPLVDTDGLESRDPDADDGTTDNSQA